MLGDTTSFYIGRRLGRGFLERHGPRVKITHERLEQVERYFDRHGGKTILIGRFIGLVRALAPFIAGSSGLPYRRFIPYSIVGTGLWATTFCVLGYIFWRSFDRVAHIAGQAVFGFGVTVGADRGVVVAYKRRREIRDWLLAHERHPLVRPLFAIGRPVYRRSCGRWCARSRPRCASSGTAFTPGELGLELTTALAVGGVGIFVFVLYLVVSGRRPVADAARHRAARPRGPPARARPESTSRRSSARSARCQRVAAVVAVTGDRARRRAGGSPR